MTLGFLFWLLFIIGVVFGFWSSWPEQPGPRGFVPLGGSLLILVLIFILGWRTFGFILQG